MTADSMDSRGLPAIDEEALLAAVLKVISGHAVVRPGETLIIRCEDWSPEQVENYQEYLDHQDLPFRVLAVIGDELAVAKPESEVQCTWPADGDVRAAEAVGRAIERHVRTTGASARGAFA